MTRNRNYNTSKAKPKRRQIRYIRFTFWVHAHKSVDDWVTLAGLWTESIKYKIRNEKKQNQHNTKNFIGACSSLNTSLQLAWAWGTCSEHPAPVLHCCFWAIRFEKGEEGSLRWSAATSFRRQKLTQAKGRLERVINTHPKRKTLGRHISWTDDLGIFYCDSSDTVEYPQTITTPHKI